MISRKLFALYPSLSGVACLAALLVGAAGCGGGGGKSSIPAPADPVAVSVPTNAATIRTNETQAFNATALHAGNLGITWSVQEGASGGTISSSGVYTAPATPGTYHVIATSQQDTTKTAVITVVVLPPISVTLAPASAVVRQGASQSFTATVQYANNNTGVTWSVQEGAAGGSITANGVYTAPGTASTYHILAASKEDSTKTATATVTVPVNVAVSPAAPTLSVRQTQTFTASVAGSSNKAVTWSVQETGGGTITSAGVYTAPSLAGTYHVLATSAADPTQSAAAAVTVQSSSATGTIQ